MTLVKWIGYLIIAFGSAPFWEKLVKFSFDVEYNFLTEWTGISPNSLMVIGLLLLVVGIIIVFFSEKKLAEKTA